MAEANSIAVLCYGAMFFIIIACDIVLALIILHLIVLNVCIYLVVCFCSFSSWSFLQGDVVIPIFWTTLVSYALLACHTETKLFILIITPKQFFTTKRNNIKHQVLSWQKLCWKVSPGFSFSLSALVDRHKCKWSRREGRSKPERWQASLLILSVFF